MFPSFNARAVGLNLTAQETIAVAAKAGFAGVDLMVRDLVEAGESVTDLKSFLSDHGLRAGAFPMPVHWRGDEEKFQVDLEALKTLADVAAALGISCTGTWVCPEIPPGLDFADCVRWHVARLGAIAQVLEARSIRLGLEVIGPARSRTGRTPRFITTLGGLTPILDALDELSSNVGLLFDSFHQYAGNEPLEEALSLGGNRIVWVHVADLPAGAHADRDLIDDPVRGLPGENGAVDNRAALKRLSEIGYVGPVTAEPLARCRSLRGLTPRETALAVRESIKQIWP